MTTELTKPDRPEAPIRLLSQPDLKALGISFSVQWLCKLVRDGRFPRPLKLTAGPHATNFWIEAEVVSWIKAKAAERPGQHDDHQEGRDGSPSG